LGSPQFQHDETVLPLLEQVAIVRGQDHQSNPATVHFASRKSWVYRNGAYAYGGKGATGVMAEWQKFVANQHRLEAASPKLVCIDIQRDGSTQAPERTDARNVGAFSDAVFQVVVSYLADDAARFVSEVESIEL
jgi:60 kDa SS-A/Ro ribonucleoprotein